jgi:hypothetical protein
MLYFGSWFWFSWFIIYQSYHVLYHRVVESGGENTVEVQYWVSVCDCSTSLSIAIGINDSSQHGLDRNRSRFPYGATWRADFLVQEVSRRLIGRTAVVEVRPLSDKEERWMYGCPIPQSHNPAPASRSIPSLNHGMPL